VQSDPGRPVDIIYNVYTIDFMKNAIINIKTDSVTKQKAHDVAEQLGIPLSNILNAYLHELAATGSVHFSLAEPMTGKMEQAVAQAEKEIAAGELSGPFETLEEFYTHLDSLK
jgi:addiction module RelB/DinJ family antitoxin